MSSANLIPSLLAIADDNAFTNLYDVSFTTGSPRNVFNLRCESVNLSGANLSFDVNESTRQHYIKGVEKPKELTIGIRENSSLGIYTYLYDWFKQIYNFNTNKFVNKNNDYVTTATAAKTERAIIAGSGAQSFSTGADTVSQYLILKKRQIEIKVLDYKFETKKTFIVKDAMIKSLPPLSLNYNSSTPIVYQVTFVFDTLQVS